MNQPLACLIVGAALLLACAVVFIVYRSLADFIVGFGCLDEPAARSTRDVEAIRILYAIDLLRDDEGNSVEIMCPNPDGPPHQAIEVTAIWTDWQPRRFTGDTLLDALDSAIEAMPAKEVAR